jgi:uncharacterized membrane protein
LLSIPRTFRRHWAYLAFLTAGATYLITLALLHHRALGTGYDLGIYDQVVWNLAHGHAFLTTLVYETNGYYDHFEPILAMIAPVYWLMPDARVLLVIQALALALGSLPVYLYARRRQDALWPGSNLPALALTVAYLALPALHNANINDFHEVALLPPLLGFALYGLLTGQRRVMLVFLGLCLMVKEDVAVTALAIGIYILLLQPRGFRRRDGLFIAIGALVWAVVVLRVFYPAVTRGMPYPFVQRRYSWLGSSPTDALLGLVTRPLVVLQHLVQPPKPWFLLQLFGPLLFLPLLGWPVIGLALPVISYLMLSDYQPEWSIQSYYNPPLLPFLMFGLVTAVIWLGARSRRLPYLRGRPPLVVAGLLVAVLLGVGYGYYTSAPGPGGRNYQAANFSWSARAAAARELVAKVPPQASISTIFDLVPQFSHRSQVYTLLARPVDPPAYLLLEPSPNSEGAPLYPYAAPPGWPPVYHEYRTVARSVPFDLVALYRSIILQPMPELDPKPQPLSLAAYGWLDGTDDASPPVAAPGQAVHLMLAWERTGHLDRRYVFFVHLLDMKDRGADGSPRIITQSGHEAGDGQFPTTFWETWTRPGIVLDEQILNIPPKTSAGQYQAWGGVYDHDSGARVAEGENGQDLVFIGNVAVAPPEGQPK